LPARRVQGYAVTVPAWNKPLPSIPVDFAAFVDQLAHVSGQAILPFFRTALGVEDKAGGNVGFDPVTEADRAAERVMRNMIRSTFPDHGIVGEEYDAVAARSDFTWVLDPIDGTKAFITGMLHWGTLIGLKRGDQAIYGMMHQPFTGERFSGDGRGARYSGPHGSRALHVRPCESLADAVVMTTSPGLMTPTERVRFRTVEATARLSRYGGDCYSYCMLAAGHVDLVIESGLKPHDIMALIPIIEGAGGVVTTWSGDSAVQGGAVVAAGDARVHQQALVLLSAANDQA
jgi:myo-inositol-1(or 4)-monophosphatase